MRSLKFLWKDLRINACAPIRHVFITMSENNDHFSGSPRVSRIRWRFIVECRFIGVINYPLSPTACNSDRGSCRAFLADMYPAKSQGYVSLDNDTSASFPASVGETYIVANLRYEIAYFYTACVARARVTSREEQPLYPSCETCTRDVLVSIAGKTYLVRTYA